MGVQEALSASAEAAPRSDVFADVFRDNAPFVWRCLRRLGVADADADDVCQEVFLVVHRKLGDYDAARGSIRSWIYGICVRKASDHRKLSHKRHEHASGEVPEGTVDAPQPDALETSRALATLDAILRTIDDDKRAAFVLYEIEGLTLEEVALALECPLQTAYSRLTSARKLVAAATRSLTAKEKIA